MPRLAPDLDTPVKLGLGLVPGEGSMSGLRLNEKLTWFSAHSPRT